jgi:hypothetical protein
VTATESDDLAFTAAAARLALIMAGGDESGCESLARTFVRASTGAGGPELVAELMDLARQIVAAFNQVNPGGLEGVSRGHERDVLEGITGALDDDT